MVLQATLVETPPFSCIKCQVTCARVDRDPVILCSLGRNIAISCCMDFEFEEDDCVVLEASGTVDIHLAGYYKSPEITSTDATRVYPLLDSII